MKSFATAAEFKRYRVDEKQPGSTLAFVPTMGALHTGHKSCIDIARGEGDLLVVSLFVNPTQFGPSEDFDAYPRPLERDIALLTQWGCDAVFAPSVTEMYERAQSVWVDVEALTGCLCGLNRPGHFRGVATVVTKLFNIVEPDVAVFGQKDAQQALIIRELARQLNMPVSIKLSPIVREADGLAISSRNQYLSGAERPAAAGLYRSLECGRDLLKSGERSRQAVVHSVRRSLTGSGIQDVEYVELLHADDLSAVDPVAGRVLLAVAARIGATRLIDNMVLEVGAEVRERLLF
jgi:pantoate--beta-alanine ligase